MVDFFSKLKQPRPTFNHIPVEQIKLVSETIDGKRFYTSPKGNKLVSVTTMIGTNPEKDKMLDKWRQRIGYHAAEKETNRCSNRGDSVHLFAELYLKNETINFNGHTQRSVSLFKRLKKLLNKINNIRGQEICLYSEILSLAGRVDCIGDYNNILSVIDFKTSTKKKIKSWITDYFIQCSAYSYMFEEMYNIKIPQIVVMIAVEGSTEPDIFIENRQNYRKDLMNSILRYNRLTK